MTSTLAADSKSELELLQYATDLKLPFETQRSVVFGTKTNGQSKTCTPDLLFWELRIAVFLDGCYWHRCQQHSREDAAASRIRAKDAAINEGLLAAGWLVLRYWEHEDLQRCAYALETAVHDRHATYKAVGRIPAEAKCRHRATNWCGKCKYNFHLPVVGVGPDCQRCEWPLQEHASDALEVIRENWAAVAYDARLIALRLDEGHPVGGAELHEVTTIAGLLAKQMTALDAGR